MAVNQVSFTSPGYDYGADISAIERRRRMAEMLQQQAAQPMEQAPVAPGQFAVPISPFQGAAKLAQAWASKRQGDKAEQQQRDLSTKAQKDLADVLRRGQLAAAGTPGTPLSEDASGNVTPAQPAVPGDPSKAAAAYLSHPTTMQMGMTIQQQELEKQRRAQMMKDIMEMGAQKGATAGGPWSPDFAAQQAQGGNPLAAVPPQALALMLSGDKELASLGGKIHEGTQGTGRVYFDEKQRAYTLNKNNQRVDVPALRGLTPAEEQRIPMERSRLWWETGQSPGPLGAPGAPQQPPMAQGTPPALAPQGAPPVAPVAPSAGSPLNLPPKDLAKIKTDTNVEAGKEFISEMRQNYAKLRDVPATIENLNRAKTLAATQAGQFMGPLGEQKLALQKFFRANVPGQGALNVEGVRSAEELRSTMFNQVMDNLKKMDAQPSQYQQMVMQDAFGTLGTDPASLPRILDVFEDILRKRVDLHNQTVTGAEGRGTRFPYDVNVKLPNKLHVFSNEAEAAKAGLKKGDRVIINGVSGTWQ